MARHHQNGLSRQHGTRTNRPRLVERNVTQLSRQAEKAEMEIHQWHHWKRTLQVWGCVMPQDVPPFGVATCPFNPYPFPWANHLFQDSASMAMGVFEGHMAKMAEGFRTIRKAELELRRDLRCRRARSTFSRISHWGAI